MLFALSFVSCDKDGETTIDTFPMRNFYVNKKTGIFLFVISKIMIAMENATGRKWSASATD